MLLSERELGVSDDHEGIVDLPDDAPGRRGLRGLRRPRRSGDRRRRHPQPAGRARRRRHRPRSRRRRPRHADRHGRWRRSQGKGACPVKVVLDFGDTPSLCPAFGLRLVRGVKNGPSPEWLQKRLPRHRASPDQRAGRHHQLRHLRPLPAAARLRREEDFRQPRRAPRRAPARRSSPSTGARYKLDPDICVIADKNGVEFDRRHHGRRALRLRRDDHRRADRIRRSGSRSTSPRPAASSASTPTPAIASSAASTRRSWCPGWSLPPSW